MYCAEFGDGSRVVRQVVLRFPQAADPASPGAADWHERQRAAARALLADARLAFAVRVGVEGRRVRRVLALCGVDVDAATLAAAAAPFLRLDDGSGRLVAACATRAEHDAALAVAPARCLQLAREPARHHALPIYDEVRLRAAFESIAPDAWRGASVAWQGAFGRAPADAATRRELGRQGVALAHAPRVPAKLVAHQQALLDAGAAAPFVLDECVFADAPDAPRLHAAVHAAFAAGPALLGVPAREIEEAAPDEADWRRDALPAALFGALPALERPLFAADEDAALAALAWQVPEAWRAHGLADLVALGDATAADLQRLEARLATLEARLAQAGRDAAACEEYRKALGITRSDPAFALVKARQILEQLVRRLYVRHRPQANDKALLFDMIRDLTGQAGKPAVLPRHIGNYLDTIRVLGNVEAHKGPEAATPRGVSAHDVEVCLLMTLNVIEWHLLGEDAAPA